MRFPDTPPPALRLDLDRHALAENWRVLDKMSSSARAGAAVKANAYGLGINHVVPVLAEAGARDFFVAHWSEVAPVLRHVPGAQLAVLHGPLSPQDAAYARETGVRPVINSLYQAQLWQDAGGGPCDLMVDTGINRLGLPMSQLGDPAISDLQIVTLLSHLASADEDVAQNARQLECFHDAAQQIPAQRRSIANSAGIGLGVDFAFDLTRPGLALYGGVPREDMAEFLSQVAHPKAAVLQARNLFAGDCVGYNATFTAPAAMRVATVSLGYADGFLRSWGPRGYLLYQGAELALLGRVSMDMVIVDCTHAPGLSEGDWLELPYDLPHAARISGLSQYELLTILGQRFGRH